MFVKRLLAEGVYDCGKSITGMIANSIAGIEMDVCLALSRIYCNNDDDKQASESSRHC